MENGDETDFSLEFNSDNTATLSVKEFGSCEIENSTSLKSLIETVVNENYNGDLNNVVEFLNENTDVQTTFKNISLIYNWTPTVTATTCTSGS